MATNNNYLNSWQTRRPQANGTTQRRQNDEKQWENMMKMINQTTPQTMLGYGLGQLLKKGWKMWEDKQGEKKRQQADNDYYHSQELMDWSGAQPVQGLLGNGPGGQYDVAAGFQALNPANPINLMAMRGEQTVTEPNGQEVTTKVAGEYPFNADGFGLPERRSLTEMAKDQLIGDNDPFGLKEKRGYLGW